MSRMRYILFTVIAVMASAVSVSRPADTMTGIFNDRIRSLQIRPEGARFGPPIILLDSPDRIRIDFPDALHGDMAALRPGRLGIH